MVENLIDSVAAQWLAIWAAFEQAGALANALQIGGFLVAVASTVRWYIHRRVQDKDGQILDLKDDLADRSKKLDQMRSDLRETQDLCETLQQRIPQTALERAEAERIEGNYSRANDILLEWIAAEGDYVSELLLQRARWVVAHAVGDFRGPGLVVAEGYAIAATVFCHRNRSGMDLVDEIERFRIQEGQWMPELASSLGGFDDGLEALFEVDRSSEADEAEREARQRYDRGYYHLALPVIDRVIGLRLQATGSHSVKTYSAQNLKVQILIWLGQHKDAVQIGSALVAACDDHDALGPDHPSTLAVKNIYAQALFRSGQGEKALPIAKAAAAGFETHYAHGPTASQTLDCKYVVAQILSALGRHEEALPIARAVAEASEQSESFGPSHPRTLNSRYLLAQTLGGLGRHKEALPIARAVAEASERSESFGPSHPQTLMDQHLWANSLFHVGKLEESLALSRQVFERSREHEALGPNHPNTLATRSLISQVLHRLGRTDEALPIARAVAETAQTALGPNHPYTLVSWVVVAQILTTLKQYEEALRLARSVTKAREEHPALGPEHPSTLLSRDLVEQIGNLMK